MAEDLNVNPKMSGSSVTLKTANMAENIFLEIDAASNNHVFDSDCSSNSNSMSKLEESINAPCDKQLTFCGSNANDRNTDKEMNSSSEKDTAEETESYSSSSSSESDESTDYTPDLALVRSPQFNVNEIKLKTEAPHNTQIEHNIETDAIEKIKDIDFIESKSNNRRNRKAAVGERKSSRLQSKETFCNKKYEAQIVKRLTILLKKDPNDLTSEDCTTLKSFPKLVVEAKKRVQKRITALDRLKEFEDPEKILEQKCIQLAKILRGAKYLVIYTGAGISTSAQIPDYRGPNGIWTLLQKGQSLDCLTDSSQKVLTTADPTVTHMAIKELHSRGTGKHIVSQNCDGLHLRSGIPKTALSEVHGNMYIEVCLKCNREYVRIFDVTENTRRYEHRTGRICYHCGAQLRDSVVHFGERGSLRWPLNWAGAEYNVDKADVILCLGSSLKVLRRYPWLWCMDKPANKRPKLIIVNLQWTPKDQFAALKIHGKCDDVMTRVMEKLNIPIPPYKRETDPIFTIATGLHPSETNSLSSKELSFPEYSDIPPKSTDLNNYVRFEPIFRVVLTDTNEEQGQSATDATGSGKKLKKRRDFKGNGNGWLGNAWGAKPKKRKLK